MDWSKLTLPNNTPHRYSVPFEVKLLLWFSFQKHITWFQPCGNSRKIQIEGYSNIVTTRNLQKCRDHEKQKRLRNCCRLKETKKQNKHNLGVGFQFWKKNSHKITATKNITEIGKLWIWMVDLITLLNQDYIFWF